MFSLSNDTYWRFYELYLMPNFKALIMSKFETLYRWTAIIQKLRRQNATYEDINFMLENLSERDDHNYNISLRSFQRDIKEIAKLFDIHIQCNRQTRHYYIESDQISPNKERLLESFEMIHALKTTSTISTEVQFEKQHSPGTENLLGILHAIRQNKQVQFIYTKFSDDIPEVRTVNPYALKEYRNRWYLVGMVPGEESVKCFGLDRLNDLEICTTGFKKQEDFDVHSHFRYSYGVIGPEKDRQPQDIELSFTPMQAKYIKTLPLHHTQEILTDNHEEVRISLKMHITYDFTMDILSYGPDVKVLKPKSLAKEIKSRQARAMERYDG